MIFRNSTTQLLKKQMSFPILLKKHENKNKTHCFVSLTLTYLARELVEAIIMTRSLPKTWSNNSSYI